PIAVAVPYRKVDFLTREVDMMKRRRDAKVDVRMRLGKMAEPMHEPLRREVGRCTDSQNAGGLALSRSVLFDGCVCAMIDGWLCD
ncbi:MAG TPA: hypothetical protein VHT52_17745, partial [Stellaceae bacterium]|nr:hypothetical protein [Stellaceae bacterium]